MRNVQNRYEVCIYDKQPKKEVCVCVTVVKKCFLCQSMFRDTQKDRAKKKEIELEETTRI